MRPGVERDLLAISGDGNAGEFCYRPCQAWVTAGGAYRPLVRSLTGGVDIPVDVVNPVVPR